MTRPLTRCTLAALAIGLMSGCGQSSPAQERPGDAEGAAAPSSKTGATTTVRTASMPDDPCAWIPLSEVEQVVGALDGSPRPAGNECVYPLAQRSEAFARLLEMRRQFRGGAADDDHEFQSVVRVSVDLTGGGVVADLATGAVAKMFAKELGRRPSEAAKKAPPPPGWDSVGGMPYTWTGRVGHLSIAVFSPPEIADEQKMALAARIRDRVPDLPFPAVNTYQVLTLGGDRNPCDLLTRAEAEAVLGGLVVEPYRAIEGSPLAYVKGKGCAYYTPGHRVFIVTAEWVDGDTTFGLSQGLGGLVGSVVPLEKAAIEGPWDKGLVDGTTGALMFLKGDRLLRVDYLMSSADRAGALRLAAQAMQRLAS